MNFKELQDEVISIRFREGQRSSIKHWLNLRSQLIWASSEWPFKHMGPVNLAVSNGDATPTLPTDFHRPISVFDDAGFELPWFTPHEFDNSFEAGNLSGTTGAPDSFKWVDDVITVYPTPDADYTYRLVYERRHTYLDSGTTPTAGLMSGDTDAPIWDSEHHYLLVHGAVATGLRLENDPTFPAIEEEFQAGLQLMREHYLPAIESGSHKQYGRDRLGSY